MQLLNPGGKNDAERNELSFTYPRLLKLTGALVGVFENVVGMWSKGSEYLKKILIDCISMGYQVRVKVLKCTSPSIWIHFARRKVASFSLLLLSYALMNSERLRRSTVSPPSNYYCSQEFCPDAQSSGPHSWKSASSQAVRDMWKRLGIFAYTRGTKTTQHGDTGFGRQKGRGKALQE